MSVFLSQSNLSARWRESAVHQILHHWDGRRNGHLGRQGETYRILPAILFIT